MAIINNGISTTNQMMKTAPKFDDLKIMEMYVNAVVNKRASIEWLRSEWWKTISEKYGLSGTFYLDFTNGELYING